MMMKNSISFMLECWLMGSKTGPTFFSRCFDHIQPGGWIQVPDVRVAGLSARDGSTAEVLLYCNMRLAQTYACIEIQL